MEEYNNKVQIVSLDENAAEFVAKSTFDHPYPTTKIMWIPDTKGTFPDLLATSGDYLRVWRAGMLLYVTLHYMPIPRKHFKFDFFL